MRDIDRILNSAKLDDIEIPQKIQHRVRYTLRNKEKSKKHNMMKRLVTSFACLIAIFIGTVGGYAAVGGKIAGKPIIEYLGIKFSDEYDNYRVTVEGQEISNNETSIKLTSTVCDDGFTILEFNVKLSDEDKEKLSLGKPILTEEYINSPAEEDGITEEDKKAVIENYTGKTIDLIEVSFNNKLITDETGTYFDSYNNFNIIIDGEEYWIRPRSLQTVNKKSDNEYTVYQMYFLTDKELGDKKEFTITLNDVVICPENVQARADWVYLPIEGQINVTVSKEKALENSKIIIPENQEIKYDDMTRTIDKIIITPLQTIVKVSAVYENVSLTRLERSQDENYIDIVNYFGTSEGKELAVHKYEAKRKITYEDGTTEDWEQGDVGTSKNFKNAKMELTEYVIIEKNKENDTIKLTVKENSKNQKELGKFYIELN